MVHMSFKVKIFILKKMLFPNFSFPTIVDSEVLGTFKGFRAGQTHANPFFGKEASKTEKTKTGKQSDPGTSHSFSFGIPSSIFKNPATVEPIRSAVAPTKFQFQNPQVVVKKSPNFLETFPTASYVFLRKHRIK